MIEEITYNAAPTISEPKTQSVALKTLIRITKYTAVRLLTMITTVVVSLYITILIANMGGYVDTIRIAQIREDVNSRMASNPALRSLTIEQRTTMSQDQIQSRIHALGLDRPFAIRSFNFLKNAITLNLGRAFNMVSNSGANSVRTIILERLPPTLLLFGVSDILLL